MHRPKRYITEFNLFYKLAIFPCLVLCGLNIFDIQAVHSQTTGKPEIRNISDYESLIKRYRYYKPDSAIYFAEKALAFAERSKDSNGIASMLNQLGIIDDNRGRFEDARQKYQRAIYFYRAIGSVKGEATETIRLGVVELRKGNYNRAIGYFLKALKLSESIGDKAGIMEAYLTLAEGYMGQKQYNTALKHLEIAERLNSTLPFSSLTLNTYNNFGIIYREKRDFKKAIAYLEKGIALSNKPQLQGLNITLVNNLAAVYAKAGFKGKSVDLLKEALSKARKIQNYLRELQTLTSLADVYNKDTPSMAIFYLQEALALAKEKKAHKQEIDLLQRLSTVYKQLKNYEKALQLKEQEHTIADSFFYLDMSKQITNLQAEYELDKSKARVQELRYQNSRQVLESRIILSFAIGLTLLLFVLVFYYYKVRDLNRLLNEANTGLQESNTIKDKIFSVLGHDLRSPIASVIGFLHILNNEDLAKKEKKELINKLMINCNASLETLNQLLKWGEMQIKGIRLNRLTFYSEEIIHRNIALLSPHAESKSITLHNEVENPVRVFADPDHFDFVIRNLLSNAIKFTGKGGYVSIGASVDETANTVKFIIKDTGIGIEDERRESIFNINHASTSGTANEKGTSLGLVMCKEFIEANKGAIEVNSKPGKGSEFIVTLQHTA